MKGIIQFRRIGLNLIAELQECNACDNQDLLHVSPHVALQSHSEVDADVLPRLCAGQAGMPDLLLPAGKITGRNP